MDYNYVMAGFVGALVGRIIYKIDKYFYKEDTEHLTIHLDEIVGYMVVHYPGGEMEQLSVMFSPQEKDKAIDFKNSKYEIDDEPKHTIAILKDTAWEEVPDE